MWFFCSLPSVQKARPQKRNISKSRNPMKVLAARDDISQSYVEVKTDIAEKEMTRIKKEQSEYCILNVAFFIVVSAISKNFI